jgi:alpha-L-rhamnosidase
MRTTIFATCIGVILATSLVPAHLRVGFVASNAVTTDPSPDLSWILQSSQGTRGLSQTSYHLQLSMSADFTAPLFDSGVVTSNATKVTVPAVGQAPADTTLFWRVCVGGSDGGGVSVWVTATFLRGLTTRDFAATWITSSFNSSHAQPVRMRAVIPAVPTGVVRAVLYVASPCYWHLFSSGTQLDDESEMGPYTVFERRVLYSAFNVTTRLQEVNGGPWAVGVQLASGPYGVKKFGFAYTGAPLILELRVTTADGTQSTYASGSPSLAFTSHLDSILEHDWYLGEVVDARLEDEFEVRK